MTMSEALNNHISLEQYISYYRGDYDQRPWGFYKVLNVGHENDEEFCEKQIGVKPKHALSLQRHHGRREIWHVKQGELTVIVNRNIHILNSGDMILIPLKAAHCMINMTDQPVIVHEKQIGICREDDNDRLSDMSGRETVEIDNNDHDALLSIKIYKDLISQIIHA